MAPRKRSAKSYKAESDARFSRIVRRPGCCHKCGSVEYVQCAHLVSRKYGATRCDLRNAIPLCAKCHRWFTINPIAWGDYCRQQFGDLIDELHRLAHAGDFKGGIVFWREKCAELKALEQAA